MVGRQRLKIAIVGTGIAGNTAAWLLRDRHDITVYEAANYIGGHTNTIDVDTPSGSLAVDTGFIVFNDRTYPEFNRLLDTLQQDWQPSVMSFSVQSDADKLEYNGAGLDALFAQRRNVARPRFWAMLRDILRFNRDAPRLLEQGSDGPPLGEFLDRHGYGDAFRRLYLYPMAAAIWSAEPERIAAMPAWFLLRFFRNHGLLQLRDRPRWRVIRGGSREYVKKLVAGHRDRVRLGTPVRDVLVDGGGVTVHAGNEAPARYDAIVIACHSDEALAMRSGATPLEREILGAIRYQPNEAVLHTDERLLPRRRKAWAAWNYRVPNTPQRRVAVTYNMNILQGLPSSTQYLVTLNDSADIAPERIIRRIQYSHPVFDEAAVAAQGRQAELNRQGPVYYCGAYWRNGFHEDGVVSAMNAVQSLLEGRQDAQLHLRRAS